MKYDLLIIGGAAAGLTAGLYAARRALKTLVISKDLGGQVSTTPTVENYPGFIEPQGGYDLMERFKKQAEKWGSEFKMAEVASLKKEGEIFKVETSVGEIEARAVILAFGKKSRHLGITNEGEFDGKGISYCVTCDGPLFKDKVTAVVGGGNAAVEAAEILSKIARKVYLIHRGDKFKAEAVNVDRIKDRDNVEFVLNTTVKSAHGDGMLTHVMTQNKDGGEKKLELDGLFVEIGFEVKADFVKDLVETDEQNQIITDPKQQTKTPGLFAAGDLTTNPYKQIVISAGEGCTAALAAYEYLEQGTASLDWSSGAT